MTQVQVNIAKPTPGEWLLVGAAIYALNDDGENRFYADVGPGFLNGRVRTPHAELEANARLISAAPDLLEAGKVISRNVPDIDGCEDGDEMECYLTVREIKALRAAIAKAEGGAA